MSDIHLLLSARFIWRSQVTYVDLRDSLAAILFPAVQLKLEDCRRPNAILTELFLLIDTVSFAKSKYIKALESIVYLVLDEPVDAVTLTLVILFDLQRVEDRRIVVFWQ